MFHHILCICIFSEYNKIRDRFGMHAYVVLVLCLSKARAMVWRCLGAAVYTFYNTPQLCVVFVLCSTSIHRYIPNSAIFGTHYQHKTAARVY